MGINFYDTAEIYGLPSGSAEISMGNAFKALNLPREKLVISTKLLRICDPKDTGKDKVNQEGLSRKHIIEGLKNSLKRLQLDYVDLVFAHRFDHITPIEEICRAFNFVIEKGWAFYWGTSEWTAEEIQRAYAVCDKLGLIKPVVEQC